MTTPTIEKRKSSEISKENKTKAQPTFAETLNNETKVEVKDNSIFINQKEMSRMKQRPKKRRCFTRVTSEEEYVELYNGKMVDILLKLTSPCFKKAL